MVVAAGVVGQIVTGLRIALARRPLCPLVDLLLRQGLAAKIAKPVEPWHGLVAAHTIEDAVDQDGRYRGWVAVGEHGHAQLLAGHHLHHGAPADPTAGMSEDPLAAIGVAPEAEAVVAMTEFGEFRCSDVNAWGLQ